VSETAVGRYERLAAAFYRDTGMMAPGKDDALGTHTHAERRAAFDAWLAARPAEEPTREEKRT
jgi:hypothetical protein